MGRFRIARRKKRGNDSFSVQKKDNNSIWQDTPFTPQQKGEQSNNLANVQKRLQLAKESGFDFSQIPLRSPDSNSTNIQRSTGSGNSDVIQADFGDFFRSKKSIARRNLRNKVFGGYKYRSKKSDAWAFTKDWTKTIFWNWRKNYGNRNQADQYNAQIDQERSEYAEKKAFVDKIKFALMASPFVNKIDPNSDTIPSIVATDVFTSAEKGNIHIIDRALFTVLDCYFYTEFNNENVHFMNEMDHWNRNHLFKKNDRISINQMMGIINVYVNSDGGPTAEYSQYLPIPVDGHPAPLRSGVTEINISSGTRAKIKKFYKIMDQNLKNGERVSTKTQLAVMDLLDQANKEIFALLKDPLGRVHDRPEFVFAFHEAARLKQAAKPGGMPGGMAKARVRRALREEQKRRGY